MTLTISEKMSVHLFVRPFVRTNVDNQTQCSYKSIYGIGRGRQINLNNMTSKVIRDQGQGHGPAKLDDFEVSSAICRDILNIVDDNDTMR